MSNHLADETSPYLLQHRDNPVDWHPWNAAALEQARAEGKPILLSIGYSACHWCHVMAHESFEDEATAALMNELYVCIKVDREERPDLDKIYQLAHQAIARRGGGWPLTVFLTPDDHLPFFAGTYFPKDRRYGMPSFSEVLHGVRNWWDQRREEVRTQNRALREFLLEQSGAGGSAANRQLDARPIEQALAQWTRNFDPQWGGFRGAPKFPHCPELGLMLDSVGATGADHALRTCVRVSLRRMAEGGIHDQIGGGFCRYSVDERWAIPHFEKMLYDNAQLLPLYARAAIAFDEADFALVAHDIVDWLSREMRDADGAFYAALDADSEGEEGKFYVWQRSEIEALLDAGERAVAIPHWGFDQAPNFEEHAWNPVVAVPLASIATTLGIDVETAQQRLQTARAKMFAARAPRVRPGLDDKRLTAWNALMISALARAACILQNEEFGALAAQALEAVRAHAWREQRLFAAWKSGQTRFPAYLDDHAFLLAALLDVLTWRWNDGDLHFAIALADQLLLRFEDGADGGFFFTAHDHEALIARQKPWFDESVPNGNGCAARALLRLGHLIGQTRYLDAAQRTLQAAATRLQETPHACASLLAALRDHLAPPLQVVVRLPDPGDAAAAGWNAAIGSLRTRGVTVFAIPAAAVDLPGALAARPASTAGVAYVCEGSQCRAPISEARELVAAVASA